MNNKNCLESKNAVNGLFSYLSSHLEGRTEFDESLFSTLEVRTLAKKEIIATDGKVSLNSFWLQKGYGRFFKLRKNSEGITEEVTIDFCKPGKILFIKDIFSNEASKEFHFQLPEGAVIIPLEEGYPEAFNLTELEAVRLIVKIMASERPEYFRRMELMHLRPRERYINFLKYFGVGIELDVLVKQVACFLKMRPSYLSRIRGELSKNNPNAIRYLQTVFFMTAFI